MHPPSCIWRPALGALLVPFLSAQPAPVRATIKPSVVRLAPGAQQRFKVILIATRLRAASAPASVQWTVNDVPGGNAEFGTIDSSGLYRAPAKAPVPHEIRVRAEAEGAANRFLWATVLMGNPDPAYKLIGGWAEKTSGAGRLRKVFSITLPGITGAIAIMFVLTVSYLMNSNFDQIFVLKNTLNADTSDVIDIYVYRMGLQNGRFSFATAIGLLKSVASLALLATANFATKRLAGRSLY